MNYEIELDGRKHRVSIDGDGATGGYLFQLDGETVKADAILVQPGILSLLLDGKSYRVLLDPRPGEKAVSLGERRVPYTVRDPRALRSRANVAASENGACAITASMPGRIVRILVEPGDRVEEQQGLIVVEAMKMQNELKAPKAGAVTRIAVAVEASVRSGEVLMVIE